jgi:hypothetical protein
MRFGGFQPKNAKTDFTLYNYVEIVYNLKIRQKNGGKAYADEAIDGQ